MNKGTSHQANHFQALLDHFRARPATGGGTAPMPPTWLDLPLDRASLQATPTRLHEPDRPNKGDTRRLQAALDLLARAIDAARMT